MKLLIVTPTLNEGTKVTAHLHEFSNQMSILKKQIFCDCIFIDGGSSDATISNLRKTNYRVEVEAGSSIYDAYNIGIEYGFKRSFDHLIFIGIGDRVMPNVLSELFLMNRIDNLTIKDLLIYSDFYWSNGKSKKSDFKINNGLMGFPHAGTVFPLSLFKDNSFDNSYFIASDLDWMLRSWDQLGKCEKLHSEEPLIELEIGGVSMSPTKSGSHLREFIRICYKNRIIPSLRFIVSKLLRYLCLLT